MILTSSLFSGCVLYTVKFISNISQSNCDTVLTSRQKKCSRYCWDYAIHANVRKYKKKINKTEEEASISCWEPNPGALQEQQVFSMTWVALQSHGFDIFTLRSCAECLVWCAETLQRQPTKSIFSCYCCFLLFCCRFSYSKLADIVGRLRGKGHTPSPGCRTL